MKIPKSVLLASLVSLAWLPLQAGQDYFADPREPHAVVTGIVNQPAKELWAVEIREVNGRRTARHEGVWLKPGTYTIGAGGAVVDRRRTTAIGRNLAIYRDRGQTIELTVEPGKTYYLALDTTSRHRDEWTLVNWRVEEQ